MGWINALLGSVGTGATTAGSAAATAAPASGIGAGLSTIGGTGTVAGAAAPSIAGGASVLAPEAAGGTGASFLSRLYGPVGAGIQRLGADVNRAGAGSVYEKLGGAIGGDKGADLGREIGGIASVGGPAQPVGRGMPPPLRTATPLPALQVGPLVPGAPDRGIGQAAIASDGYVIHQPMAPAPGTAGVPIKVGY